MHGVALGNHLITDDDVAWRRVILELVCALTHCAPLVAEMLLGVWFYHQTQASHVIDLDGVETSDGHQPISVDNLMVS